MCFIVFSNLHTSLRADDTKKHYLLFFILQLTLQIPPSFHFQAFLAWTGERNV